MAYRDRSQLDKKDFYEFSVLEVMLHRKGQIGLEDQLRLVTIDNHLETLRFVHDNLDACIGNIVKLRKLEEMESKC